LDSANKSALTSVIDSSIEKSAQKTGDVALNSENKAATVSEHANAVAESQPQQANADKKQQASPKSIATPPVQPPKKDVAKETPPVKSQSVQSKNSDQKKTASTDQHPQQVKKDSPEPGHKDISDSMKKPRDLSSKSTTTGESKVKQKSLSSGKNITEASALPKKVLSAADSKKIPKEETHNAEKLKTLESEPKIPTHTTSASTLKDAKESLQNETRLIPKPVIRSAPASTKGLYTVQVYSSPSREDAEDWLGRLREKNLDATFISKQNVRGTTYFRVRFGAYTTKEEAETAAMKSGYASGWIDRVK
jgi:cell division septation protein DedD